MSTPATPRDGPRSRLPFPASPVEPATPQETSHKAPLSVSEQDEVLRTKRAQRIAIAARDAGLDDEVRGDLIAWYTFDQTRHGRDLTDEQAAEVFLILQKIRTHKYDIRYTPEGKLFLDGHTR